MQWQAVPDHVDQRLVEIGYAAAYVNHDYQTLERLALQQEARQYLVPMAAHFLRYLGKTVAGQVDQASLWIEFEKIDQLGASWRLAGFAQVFLARQAVNRARLARIRAPGKRDLGTRIGQ